KKPESKVILSPSNSAQSKDQDDKTMKEAKEKSPVESVTGYRDLNAEFQDCSENSSNEVPTASTTVPTVGQNSHMPGLEDIIYSDDEDIVDVEADFNNLESSIPVSPISTTRIHKDHPVSQIIGDLSLTTQTRSMTKAVKDQGGLSQMFGNDFHNCMFACFLSQEEPKRVHQALKDPSWIEAMQEKLLQFKMQKVWVLVDLPYEKRAIARIEAIRLFLAYASFMGFMVYQMDVKSAFLYGTIEEEVYVYQPLGFEDLDHPDKVYKVVKALYGLHQAPRACQDKYVAEILRKFGLAKGKSASTPIDTEKPLLKDLNGEDVDVHIYRLSEGKSASTPIDAEKPLLKDSDGEDVDVHTYRSMIGSLMYLTSSRLDIMFAVCSCARFQVNPKLSHLNAVKRIFRYLKGKPCLGLWYLKDSPFDLVAYSDSDYAGASLYRKSTTGGCQFLRCRLISWKCKKQTFVATSSTEAEYVGAASGCAQVLWMQNQLLDYGDSPLLGVNTPRSDEDRLKLMELMVFLLQNGVCDEFELNAARLSKFLLSGKYAAGGFEQIIDFLSGSYINHALTVNPHVYISCIKQFWNTAVVKRSGVICLPNDEIFAGLARMGYEKPSTKLTFYKAFFSTQWMFFIYTIQHSLSAKRTSWNEFSSAMASALIYLSSGQRFNFSKYIFESLVRNVDISSKFYMHPRFIQLIIQTNIADLSKHTNRYISLVLTQKVPAQDDVVQEHVTEEIATEVVPPTPTSPVPSSPVIPSSPPYQSPCPPQPQDAEGSTHLFQQVLDTCSAFVLRVEGLKNANAAQQLEIITLKARVKKLGKLNKVKSPKLRRLRKVGTSQRIESSDDVENVFNQGRISVDMDQDEGIELVVDQEKDAEIEGRQADKQAEIYNIDLDHSSKVLSMQEDDTEVVAASTPIIPAAKPKSLKIAAAPAVSTRRRKGV
nr:hypothetical protein [Tanacetum cinerariifolium]